MRIRRLVAAFAAAVVLVMPLAVAVPASADESVGGAACRAAAAAYERLFKRDAPWYCTT